LSRVTYHMRVFLHLTVISDVTCILDIYRRVRGSCDRLEIKQQNSKTTGRWF
jgi:hypothetical protein